MPADPHSPKVMPKAQDAALRKPSSSSVPAPNTSQTSDTSPSRSARGALTSKFNPHWTRAKMHVAAAVRIQRGGTGSKGARKAVEDQMYLDTIRNPIGPMQEHESLETSGANAVDQSSNHLPRTPAPSSPTSNKEHQSLPKFPVPPSLPTVIVPVGQIGSPGAASRKPEHSSRKSAPRSQTYGLFPSVGSESSDGPKVQGRKQSQALTRRRTSP